MLSKQQLFTKCIIAIQEHFLHNLCLQFHVNKVTRSVKYCNKIVSPSINPIVKEHLRTKKTKLVNYTVPNASVFFRRDKLTVLKLVIAFGIESISQKHINGSDLI